ncbi:restriction endonuclease subunit S [Pseudoalteromonas peptidolytica]|nr:restriction endonuclease subunit S [Pseudoalteromonas peptidolytica]GEK10078.1 hypothetical protein PPE03_23270 [Pseudoalteromonas peptidolytica]
MSEQKSQIKGWTEIKFGDYLDIQGGSQPPKSTFVDSPKKGYVRLLQIRDFGNKPVPTYVPEDSVTKFCTKEDIFVARYGASLGRILTGMEGAYNVALAKVIYPNSLFDNKYLYYLLHTPIFQHPIKMISRSAQNGFNKGDLSPIKLPVPPYEEQFRISEKLDELFSELDFGAQELKTAQVKLKHYRQSLLKSAVEGALTQKWRDDNKDKIEETGKELLNRILIERKQRWEQEKLAEFKEKGKKPPKNWQDKYPEPVQPDTTDLPELPEGWVWASMSQISHIQGGIQKQPKRRPVENKYPFLRVANVYRNELRLDEIHEIELFGDELQRLSLLKGDILIVEGNGSKSEIGRCAIWNNEIENAVHQNHLIRTRPVLALSKYVALWLNSPAGMDIMSNLAATTSGLYTLSVSKISKVPVPIPSLCEQQMITNKIDTEFDSIDRQVEATALGLKQSEAQRKNILKSAFSGQLVPQDPDDEPASVLLEKIKQERVALAKISKPRKQSKPRKRVELMNTLLEVLTAENDWIDAQNAFQKCGIVDGTSTDRIEEIYTELRKLEKTGRIEIQRQGDFDQLKLTTQDIKED